MSTTKQVTETDVQNALGLYFFHLERGEDDDFAKLFADEGTLELCREGQETKVIKGYDELVKFAQTIRERLPNALHNEHNPIIAIHGGVGNNYSNWTCLHNGKLYSYGRHEDTFTFKFGKVQFLRRKVTFLFTHSE